MDIQNSDYEHKVGPGRKIAHIDAGVAVHRVVAAAVHIGCGLGMAGGVADVHTVVNLSLGSTDLLELAQDKEIATAVLAEVVAVCCSRTALADTATRIHMH